MFWQIVVFTVIHAEKCLLVERILFRSVNYPVGLLTRTVE